MKRILLTSTALVAFAGAAAAEVTWGGDAEIGYNDDVKNGFYWSVGASFDGEMELSGGLTAGFSLDVDIAPAVDVDAGADGIYGTKDDVAGMSTGGTFKDLDIKASDYELYLKSDTAGLYFGDTDSAADKMWSGTKNMGQDSFNESGDAAGEEATLRGEVTIGGLEAAISYAVVDTNRGTKDDDLTAMQLGVSYTTGAYNFGLAYQDEDNAKGEIFGVWAGGTFGGADVKIAYAKNNTTDEDSLGLQVGYAFGPVDALVFYSAESATDDNYGIELGYENGPVSVDFWYHDGADEEVGLEGSYDMGNGLVMNAGIIDYRNGNDPAFYVGGEYDLGGGASLLVSYAEDDTDADSKKAGFQFNDEIGDPEYNHGTTIAVSFEF